MSARFELERSTGHGPPSVNVAELRFLVVEDQGFQRWIVGNLLAKLGAKHVISAPDGATALEIYKGADPPIDIIVSDLDMPGMDGMEFIRHVGEMVASGLERTLVASVETMARAYGVNLLAAIEKPVTAKKLVAAIDLHALASNRADRLRPAHFTLDEILAGLRADQFEPYFQAKMNLVTRAVVGAEAVARWHHPEKGLIEPQSFVAMLDESGHMEELTAVMLIKGAAACASWRQAGVGATLSVNVSPTALTDTALADRLTEFVAAEGLMPRDVVLEVTESAATTHLGKVLENLSRLRMKGFGLSIDDYGTGYSSMQQLTRIPFTELKIDQSFVRNASTQPSNRAMLESSLEMAAKLKIAAVAEGVETQADWDLLLELGCPLGQGYFIARPMQAAEFLRWLRA